MQREDKTIRAAVDRIIAFLNAELIVEGCGGERHVLGCASCDAIRLRQDLISLLELVADDGKDPA